MKEVLKFVRIPTTKSLFCRICFGQRLFFVVSDYRKLDKLKQEKKKPPPPVTYEFAQQEMARDFTDNIDGGKGIIIVGCSPVGMANTQSHCRR